MGYRSHVLFAIRTVEDTTLRLAHPEVLEVLRCADRVIPRDGYTIYEWDLIKWYYSWAPVAALGTWMRENEETEEGEAPYSFLRDGDELEDFEHRGSWELSLNYGIWFDDDKTPRITDAQRKALAFVIAMVEGEWGQYMDENFQNAVTLLKPLSEI